MHALLLWKKKTLIEKTIEQIKQEQQQQNSPCGLLHQGFYNSTIYSLLNESLLDNYSFYTVSTSWKISVPLTANIEQLYKNTFKDMTVPQINEYLTENAKQINQRILHQIRVQNKKEANYWQNQNLWTKNDIHILLIQQANRPFDFKEDIEDKYLFYYEELIKNYILID